MVIRTGKIIQQINGRNIQGEDGQSTIEFLVSFTLVLGFLFAFLKLAIVYTNGYLVHYVTFQASRAYMITERGSNSPAGSDSASKDAAEELFDAYKIETIIPGFSGRPIIEDPESNLGNAKNLYVGVRVEFEEYISIPGGNAKINFPLTSESYLGKEPTHAECFERICRAFSDLPGVNGCMAHTTVADNGC